MSRPSCTDQKGQALVELVLATVLMVPLFLLTYQCCRFLYARLELVSVTREATLFMIHENKQSIPEGLFNELAIRSRLNRGHLKAEIQPALLGEELKDIPAAGAVASVMTQFLIGSKLVVTYRFHFQGALGKLMPEGVLMTESTSFQSGTWKNLGTQELINLIFSWLNP